MGYRAFFISFLFLAFASCSTQNSQKPYQTANKGELQFDGDPVYDFGQVPVEASGSYTFTLRNVGALEVTQMNSSFSFSSHFGYKRADLSSPSQYPGAGGTCGVSLAPNSVCTVVMDFAPKYVGAFTEQIVVNYFNGNENASTSQPKLLGNGSWGMPGTLDPTFNGNGKLFVSLGSAQDKARAVAVQSDGLILVGGSYYNGTDLDFAIVRRYPTGEVDTTFGTNGVAIFGVGTGDDILASLVLQDGKILAAGSSRSGGNAQASIVRLNSNGTVDLSFGTSGKVSTTVGTGDATPRAMAVQSDRKILLAGYADNGATKDVMLLRYTSSGVLDSTFSGAGIVLTPVGAGNDFAEAIQIVSTKVYLAGSTYNGADHDFLALRFLETGALDTSYNGTGKVTFAVGTNTDDKALTMQVASDGRMALAGYTKAADEDFAVARLTSAGALDTTFNGTGKNTVSFGGGVDIARGLLLASDLRVTLAGESSGSPALARFSANGSLDTTFGTLGKVVTAMTGSIHALVAQANGKLLTAGETSSGGDFDFSILRYWP